MDSALPIVFSMVRYPSALPLVGRYRVRAYDDQDKDRSHLLHTQLTP